jgi:hypothetical protein
VAIALVLVLVSGARSVEATVDKGSFMGSSFYVQDGDIKLTGTAFFIIHWKIYPLLGEPVVYCDAAWFFAGKVTVVGHGKPIPRDVLEKIRITDAKMIAWLMPGRRDTLTCDLGAMGAPYLIPYMRSVKWLTQKVRSWRGKTRARYRSYNTPGSPDWTELFRHGTSGSWLSETAAKAIMKGRIRLEPLFWHGIGTGFRSLRFDLSAVREWMAKPKIEVLNRAKREREAKRVAERQRQAQRDRAPAKDFWETPDNDETTASRRARRTEDARIRTLERDVRRTGDRVRQQRLAYKRWLQNKRDEIRNRPKPGSDKYVIRASRQLPKLVSSHFSVFSHPSSKHNYDTKTRAGLSKVDACKYRMTASRRYRLRNQSKGCGRDGSCWDLRWREHVHWGWSVSGTIDFAASSGMRTQLGNDRISVVLGSQYLRGTEVFHNIYRKVRQPSNRSVSHNRIDFVFGNDSYKRQQARKLQGHFDALIKRCKKWRTKQRAQRTTP